MIIPFVDLKRQYAVIKQQIDANIHTVLNHASFIGGPEVSRFERALAEFSGAEHVVGCASGTDALQVLLMAKGIGKGDAVFVPSFTYTATAEAILLLGAKPVFVEVDARSFNIDASHLEFMITRIKSEGQLTPRAIIAVDLFGLPADYSILNRIADREGMFLIADAAQSFGASVDGHKVGHLAPATATSFFPAKPLGCYGDGGAVFTNDAQLADIVRSICLHGKGREKYDVVRLGVNSRLDTLQAAVLLAKLEIFPAEIERRNEVAKAYDREFEGLTERPIIPNHAICAWAQYTIKVEKRDLVQASLKSLGIPTAVYYPLPMHLQPAYVAYGEGIGSLPVSEHLSEVVLSLPMHGHMTDEEVNAVTQAVRKVIS